MTISNLGVVLSNMKKYDESIRALNKAIELDARSTDAHSLKGIVFNFFSFVI